MDWSIDENADWLSVDPVVGTNEQLVTIDYFPNADEERIEEIVITAPAAVESSLSLYITQGEPSPILAIDPDTLVLSASADNTYFTISNEGMGAMLWLISEDESWLSVDPESGRNNGEVRVNYNTNRGDQREGEITVFAPDATPSTLILSLTQPSINGSIVSVQPDHANQGDELTVSITGLETEFRFLSEHSEAVLERDNRRITSSNVNILSNELLDVNFEIPMNAEPGVWTVSVEDVNNYRISLREGFSIEAP